MLTRPALISALLAFSLCLGCSNSHRQFQRARALEKSGKPAEALDIYESLLKHTRVRSGQSVLYVHIGECEWSLDHQPESLNAFLKAAELDPENTTAQIHLAQLFLAAGAPDRALAFAEIVLSHDPGNLDAMTADAQAYAFLGNIPDATTRFEEVLQRDPGRVDAAVTLAQIYETTGNDAQARNVLLTAVAHSPNSTPLQLALGQFEEEQGRANQAEAAYRRAVSLQDDANTNLRLAQFLERSARIPEAENVLRKVDRLRPAKPYALADFQLLSGKGTDASRQYLDLLMRHDSAPSDGKDKAAAALAARAIESKLAQASSTSGTKRDQALQEARTALGTHRAALGETMTSVLAAEMALVQGDANASATLARAAVDTHSDSPSAHYVLGLALSHLGKNSEARAEWEKVLEDSPEFVPARLSLAELSLGENDLAGAEKMVVPVVRQEPANLAALKLFARVLIAQKDFGAANSIAMRYEVIDKTSPEPHLLLGEAALAEHRLAYALIEFEQAVLLDPDSTEAMDGLVRVYRQGTITRPMLRQMEHSATTPPASSTLMELAGRLYEQHGWTDDAARCFRAALQLDPKRASAAIQLTALESRAGHEEAASSSAAGTSVSNSLLLSAVRAGDAKNNAAAIREYEAAISKGDSTGVAANNLAWIYAEQGTNLDRALQLAQSAREANPVNPAVTDTLGFVLLRRHEYSMALAELKRADELFHAQKSKDSELATAIHQHLSEAYRSSGEPENSAQ